MYSLDSLMKADVNQTIVYIGPSGNPGTCIKGALEFVGIQNNCH